MVERLNPLGLNGIKITLDGDRDAHNQSRPLRGGQGTFDKIIANVRAVADLTPIAVGGNFEMETADSAIRRCSTSSRAQDFAPRARQGQLQAGHPREEAGRSQGHDSADRRRRRGQAAQRRVHDVGRHRRVAASATRATSSTTRCRSCARRRKKRGFTTSDGVHNGPVRDPQGARPHHRPRRLALRLPRLRRRGAAVDRPHRRPRRAVPARRRSAISRSSRRGRCATTARSSRSAPAAAPWRRTTSWATCTRPTATSRASKPGSSRSRTKRAAREMATA